MRHLLPARVGAKEPAHAGNSAVGPRYRCIVLSSTRISGRQREARIRTILPRPFSEGHSAAPGPGRWGEGICIPPKNGEIDPCLCALIILGRRRGERARNSNSRSARSGLAIGGRTSELIDPGPPGRHRLCSSRSGDKGDRATAHGWRERVESRGLYCIYLSR